MATLERKEVKEQAKSALTAKEKNVIKKAAEKKDPRLEEAMRETERQRQKEQTLNQEKQLTAKKIKVLKLFQDRNTVIDAINRAKRMSAGISFGSFMKRWILDASSNFKMGNIKFNDNYSEMEISYEDSLGKDHVKKMSIPTNGNLDLAKVFTYLHNDIQSVEKKIWKDKTEKLLITWAENFKITNLSKKAQSWLKEKNYVSSLNGGVLDLKKGVWSWITVSNNVLSLGALLSIQQASKLIKNGKFDNNAFKAVVAKHLDVSADKYYQNDVRNQARNLSNVKMNAITDNKSKTLLNSLEQSMNRCRELWVIVPQDSLKVLNEKKYLLKKMENFYKEDKRLAEMYKKYDDLFNSVDFVVFDSAAKRNERIKVDNVNKKMVQAIAKNLSAGTLAASLDKTKSSKSYFDAVGQQAKYQEYVKKFQSLLTKMSP